MVMNGHEKYPDTPQDKPYPVYNFAPAKATFKLAGIEADERV